MSTIILLSQFVNGAYVIRIFQLTQYGCFAIENMPKKLRTVVCFSI
jgi:hypothetical protein